MKIVAVLLLSLIGGSWLDYTETKQLEKQGHTQTEIKQILKY